jgi:hypothetical protein
VDVTRYRVTGRHPVRGVRPGGTLEGVPEYQARRLVSAGHVVEVHVCDDCGRELKTKSGLVSHRRTHEEDEEE